MYPGDSFELDTLTLVPGSIVVKKGDDSIPSYYDLNTGKITIQGAILNDSLEVCYRVFPIDFKAPAQHRDLSLYDSLKIFRDNLHYDEQLIEDQREELFSSPGLYKTGNLSRGISFGNNQNVGVSSNLNIQLEGKLTEDISILGSISDQNIPFQPEGNTATLQEFDRVYLKLFTDKTELAAGDLRLTNKEESYFLKYLKNVQGGQLTTNYGNDSTFEAETSIGAAISKGKFNSVFLDVREGVQGPYKLRGANGQRFIVVIANSEKVYLDGEPLQRGFDFDYTIDYNNGEITFTNNVIITRFSRVRVDYEYSDLNYSRTTINASHYQQSGKLDLYLNYFSAKDNRNNPLNIELDNSDKEVLSLAGDDPLLANVPSFREVSFSDDIVLYKSDTVLVSGVSTPIFVYTTNRDSAQYEVRFSLVGEGNGNYVRQNTTANGQVYAFVPPVAGVQQGAYEPVQLLPAPEKNQMVTAGLGYQLNDNEKIRGEFAFSDNDENLYSDIDNNDNLGYSYIIGAASEGREVVKDYKLNTTVDFEFNHRNFSRIDRFRYVEFDRDWSANSNRTSENVLFNGSLGLKKDEHNLINYSISYRDKENDIRGTQQRFIFNQSLANLYFKSDGFFLRSETSSGESTWNRLNTDLSWQRTALTSGLRYKMDKNTLTNNNKDITGTAMFFDAITGYVHNADTNNFYTSLEYTYREDKDTLGNELSLANVSHTANMTVRAKYGKGSLLRLKTVYRALENVGGFASLEGDKTLMNRLDWNTSLFKRAIRSELTFSNITGREARRDFLYLPIFDGSGTHVYVGDLNDNGVKDIDEFSLKGETIFDTTYIKTFIPTDDFIEAYATNINYRLNMSAPREWTKSKGLKKFASRFSNISSWSLDRKITDDDLGKRFNPFAEVNENQLLTHREQLRMTFFYNRSNPTYGMDLTYFSTRSKQLLSNGFDSLGVNEWRYNSRVNIKRKFNLKLGLTNSDKTSNSDFLLNKNYRVVANSIFPELSFQPGNVFRITGKYRYTDKMNLQGAENTNISEAALNVLVTQLNKRTINAQLSRIDVKTNQDEGFSSTIVGFEMMDGLKEGVNWTWQLNYQQKIANGLQFNLSYNGRKSPDVRPIHIGRMQLAALF